MSAVEKTDAELVSRSLAGNRDAFGQIVARYQTLICSLAYSATGSLPQSEDLSQETFVTAWKQLPQLNEPAKLRPWLCGIVRNLIRRTFRQLIHEPSHAAESLETAQESPAVEPLPGDQAVTREEEAIMWRSLERIPEIYREPLILFYREHQSIERVAEELELSEDAVKQRLSRGRKLLHEQVRMFVETALRKSAPGTAFAIAVIAALPVAMTQTAKAAGAGAAAKAAAAGKTGGVLATLAAWLPFLGLAGGVMGFWASIRASRSQRERKNRVRDSIIWGVVVVAVVAGQAGLGALSTHYSWSDEMFVAVMASFWWLYAVLVVTLTVSMVRRAIVVRWQDVRSGAISPTAEDPIITTNAGIFWAIGVHLISFVWLIDLAWQSGDRLGAGITAAAMVASCMWTICRLRNKTHAAKRMTWAHLGVIFGVIILMLNWRVDVWMAAMRGIDLAEAHRLLPMWTVHLMTVAFLLVVGALLAFTNRGGGSRQAASLQPA